MKKFLKAVFVGIVLLVVADVAAAFYFLHVALAKTTCVEDEYDVWQREKQRVPFAAAWLDSIRDNNCLQDLLQQNAQGRTLHAYWLCAPKPTKRTAILLHGYRNQALNMLHIAYMYSQFGFNVLMPDFFGHGLSEGTHVRMGWRDRNDVIMWAHVADSLLQGAEITVHGISMGAATTMMVAGENPQGIVAYVEDCGYTSVWDEFESEFRKRYGLPSFPLLHTSSALCFLLDGWTFGRASALEAVERSRAPMLFIHGDADDFVPTWMATPLYNAKSGMRELWLSPGVGHAASYDKFPAEYTSCVRNFLQKAYNSSLSE
ncbi:MAG: alpha/beta hydrolase [Bacteroidaceae bacterium]|nr:alpha/beta hydrolase [Bacteroidaceae bacterium]